jgi:hypothetical protein
MPKQSWLNHGWEIFHGSQIFWTPKDFTISDDILIAIIVVSFARRAG